MSEYALTLLLLLLLFIEQFISTAWLSTGHPPWISTSNCLTIPTWISTGHCLSSSPWLSTSHCSINPSWISTGYCLTIPPWISTGYCLSSSPWLSTSHCSINPPWISTGYCLTTSPLEYQLVTALPTPLNINWLLPYHTITEELQGGCSLLQIESSSDLNLMTIYTKYCTWSLSGLNVVITGQTWLHLLPTDSLSY